MGCLLFWMATTTLKFGSCFRVGLLIAGCGLTLTLSLTLESPTGATQSPRQSRRKDRTMKIVNYWSLRPKRQVLKFTKAMMERCKAPNLGCYAFCMWATIRRKPMEPTHR